MTQWVHNKGQAAEMRLVLLFGFQAPPAQQQGRYPSSTSLLPLALISDRCADCAQLMEVAGLSESAVCCSKLLSSGREPWLALAGHQRPQDAAAEMSAFLAKKKTIKMEWKLARIQLFISWYNRSEKKTSSSSVPAN
ncbi:hypothetical protein NDU88_001271 [Pleurodeles waltl]|uniref:Uncharacterized protein n=1 Tax=Pleurodeles waltl TaxID=8319 RepID=A0AAV7MU71_PLEWA|nr:hypothetical protein NDU88_001271 [Pleurodeles waltl]